MPKVVKCVGDVTVSTGTSSHTRCHYVMLNPFGLRSAFLTFALARSLQILRVNFHLVPLKDGWKEYTVLQGR